MLLKELVQREFEQFKGKKDELMRGIGVDKPLQVTDVDLAVFCLLTDRTTLTGKLERRLKFLLRVGFYSGRLKLELEGKTKQVNTPRPGFGVLLWQEFLLKLDSVTAEDILEIEDLSGHLMLALLEDLV